MADDRAKDAPVSLHPVMTEGETAQTSVEDILRRHRTGDHARPLRHVAIIMDGNGRWARQNGVSHAEGHAQGVVAARAAIETADELGLSHVTLFSFSTENWNRPKTEISHLMRLLADFIKADLPTLKKRNVRVRVIGDHETIPAHVRPLINRAEKETENNSGSTLQIAFNYGGRNEIIRAAKAMAKEAASGQLDPDAINERVFETHLDTNGAPDPDLVIRTSGEYRISNFLLWQAAYAEFVFLDEYWPDFTREKFIRAVGDYYARERRFGGRV